MAQPSFEKDLEKLEQIVEALEEGGLSLDEALKRFEDGMKLARRCDKALTEAERRIEVLVRNADGELEAQPFDEGEGETLPSSTGETEPPAKARRAAKPASANNDDNTTGDDDEELLF